jgi:hypothetical protein
VVLEHAKYKLIIAVTGLAAVGLVAIFARTGVLTRFSWLEPFKLQAFLMILSYPTAKAIEKLRDPGRQVLQEMGSVYSSRLDRCLLLLLSAAIITIATEQRPAVGPTAYAPPYAAVAAATSLVTALTSVVVIVACVVDQGLAFFDLRIANTYVERERHRGGGQER